MMESPKDAVETLVGKGPEREGGQLPTNVLLISLKRQRSFYERATRELLASNVDTVYISALGDAICTAVELAGSLEDKKIVTIEKIETKYQPSRPSMRRGATPSADSPENIKPETEQLGDSIRTPGIYITLRKHTEFKGSRIAPHHVSWNKKISASLFNEEAPVEFTAAIVAGVPTLDFSNGGITLTAMGEVLASDLSGSHNLAAYNEVHTRAFEKAYEIYKAETEERGKGFKIVEYPTVGNDDLKAVYCRPCTGLVQRLADGWVVGSVFIDVFQDGKTPYKHARNVAMVYVVTPTSLDFPEKQSFLDAIRMTAANIMTAVCDFNGTCRRRQFSVAGLKRIMQARVGLFPSLEHCPPDVTNCDLASSILAGLDSEFHYGASPRLCFSCEEEEFKTAWTGGITAFTKQT